MSPTLIAGGVAAGAIVLLGLQTMRLGNAQEAIGALEVKVSFQVAQTEEAVGVNVKLNGNIDELAGKIAAMIEGRRLEREERDRLLAVRDEDLAAAREAARRLEGERDALFRDDLGCAEMGAIRVDLSCGLIAVQLRERSNRGSGDGGTDGGGPGGSDGPGADPDDSPHTVSATVQR